jgi:putative transposase
VVSVAARREQVEFACERGLSKRRAATLLAISRSALAYRPVLPERDRPSLEAMQRLSGQCPRFGSRRIRVLLAREGHVLSRNKAVRLWRAMSRV